MSESLSQSYRQKPRVVKHVASVISNLTTATPKKNRQDDDAKKKSENDKKDKTPLCLWKLHKEKGLRHYMKDCKQCPEHEKKKLLEDLVSSKKKGKPKRVQEESSKSPSIDDSSSVLFSAMFSGKVTKTVCADIGAANLLDAPLMKVFGDKNVSMKTEKLSKPTVLEMAALDENGNSAKITCRSKITIDLDLHIRHGTSLMLRNVQWFVTDQQVSEPLLRRPLLESLGLNTEDILAAAADRFNVSLDLSDLAVEENGRRIARSCGGVFHSDGSFDDDQYEESAIWLDLGEESDKEWEIVLQKALSDTVENEISPSGKTELEALIREFRDNVRIRLNGKNPAKGKPLELNLKHDHLPVRAKQRKYSPEKRKFMEDYVNNLLALRFVKHTEDPEWVSDPNIVQKKPPALFRMAIYNRPINAATVPVFRPMPDINNDLSDTRRSKYFIVIDFCSGYWQLPMQENSQPLHAFMTPQGVVQPTRTTQGANNSAANFQQKVEPCFAELRDNLKAWIDDFMMYAKTEADALVLLRRFLEICRDKNLVISLPKSRFFAKSIKWCGRIIDGEGYRFDTANYEALKNNVCPTNASELCQFAHAATWMATAIPALNEQAVPLQKLLEKAYAKVCSRKKKSVKKVRLSDIGWDDSCNLAFQKVRESLCNAVKLSNRDPKKIMCVHTDASDKFWSGIVTQCHSDELSKPFLEEHHEPLAFLGSQFSPTKQR